MRDGTILEWFNCLGQSPLEKEKEKCKMWEWECRLKDWPFSLGEQAIPKWTEGNREARKEVARS